MRIFMLEDEPLAAEKLQELIRTYLPEGQIVGHVRSMQDGLQWLQQNQEPDLIFSDIELLDCQVFRLFEQHPVRCPIIFSTAYDQYLLQAFQTSGIAYLLKPYDARDFREAVAKYQRLFQTPAETQVLNSTMIQQLKAALQPGFRQYKQRFTVKKASGIVLLNVPDIHFFRADGNLILAYAKNGKRHAINHKLTELEEILDPAQFFRINRSEIIALDAIEKIDSYFNDRLAVQLPGAAKALIVSASRVPDFRKWIEK